MMRLARDFVPAALRKQAATCAAAFVRVPARSSLFQNASVKQMREFATAAGRVFGATDGFWHRHIGPNEEETKQMLKQVGVDSLDKLIDGTVPAAIRNSRPLNIGEPVGERQALDEFKQMMSQNKLQRQYIGLGYYDTVTPAAILRNIIENPKWYTPYTPYSAEIAQGRLEMLLNFQTVVCDLTGLPCANASLLDEGTAAAEAMYMCVGEKKEAGVFLISDNVHPQTIEVVKTRAKARHIEVKVQKVSEFNFSAGPVSGVLVQYPGTDGRIEDFTELTKKAHDAKAYVVVASDLLALTQLTPPGEWGADIVLGSAQRFGVPLGFGGPHAAFFATQEEHKRKMPGRIIGVSRDWRGKKAYRMAMQTREQHIRRDKATSNICTAQALLANTAAAYAIYHGADGLKAIANKVHSAARTFAAGAEKLGYAVQSQDFFDTVHLKTKGKAAAVAQACLKNDIQIRVLDNDSVTVAFGETVDAKGLNALFAAFGEAAGNKNANLDAETLAASLKSRSVTAKFARKSGFLTHPVFNAYRSETELMRYLDRLCCKDLSLTNAMIPLGSCTMKLNAASEMIPVTFPEVNSIHPFAPAEATKGYEKMVTELEGWLNECTGFAATSLQPNAGSQGEFAGLLAIQAYHRSRGQGHRNICLIPTSAHGTNPASAVMAGMKVVVTACDQNGNVDVADLKAKAEQHKENLSCLMITYPSTHGVYEESIKDITKIVHDNGGQVYMDGANMNAQVGLTSPGAIGADVCHLNLHKTFCIPHGGGGPGMGPICVAKHLAPFLPRHPLRKVGGDKSEDVVAAAPYSSASILPISYMYIKMMGGAGLTRATKYAILNANYMAKRLEKHYKILYTGKQGFVAHEFIIDMRGIKAKTGISEEDVAKRLLDFNFHSPTMSFPVVGTLMIEPTESESKFELDRFCDAMIKIREEIAEVESGKADPKNNVLKGAPHPAEVVLADNWDRPYGREKAAYPLPYLRDNKFWPSVGRIDNVFGDRNVVCTCPPIESYANN